MKWQDIKTAPVDGTSVLLLWPQGSAGRTVACEGQYYYAKDGESFWWSPLRNMTEPTHWMPLPADPGAMCKNCGGPEVDHEANYYCPEFVGR